MTLHHFARDQFEPGGRQKAEAARMLLRHGNVKTTRSSTYIIPGDRMRTGQRFRERSFEIFRLKRLLQHRAISILWTHARRSVPGRKDERHVLLA